ncbi:MAG TPA: DNA-directed RNA polymerase subunit alpha C-terminal domain-containing protein [Niastella sp.]|nr:DNA-directed RNA polymerase subunit alpha C-terminal domain-containing protein [Niastella sp.]
MNRYDHEIAHLQNTLQHFDIKQCRLIASWLLEHIHTLEADERLYHTSIQQLHLSTRTFNILQYNKITTIGQLLKISADWDRLKQLKGAGVKVLQEIKEKLDEVKAGKQE